MRVYGKADNIDLVFQFDGESWLATVPAGSGAYTVELFAEDDAGNVSHMTTVLVTYDIETMCFRFEIVEVGAGFSAEDVTAMFRQMNPEFSLVTDQVELTASTSHVELEIIDKNCGGGDCN